MNPQEISYIVTAIAAIVAIYSGIRAAGIDNLKKILDEVQEDNKRLNGLVEELRKQVSVLMTENSLVRLRIGQLLQQILDRNPGLPPWACDYKPEMEIAKEAANAGRPTRRNGM